MYELAKQSREKMKARAKSLAGEKDQKVDSSDWSPAAPINAEAKTGMRPVSKRAYKGGGKVSGSPSKTRADRKARKSGGRTLAEELVNRNVKEANESREGVKHIGGMKKGGRAARAEGGGIYDKKALGAIDPRPVRSKAEHYKKGGKIKREEGGRLPSPEEAIGSEVRLKGIKVMPSKSNTAAAYQRLPSAMESARSEERLKGIRMGRKSGGKAEHPDVAEDRALVKKMVKKTALTGNKKGGRVERKAGGRTKGKTDINIVIAAGHKPPMQGMPPIPPAGAMPPPPPPAMPPVAAPPPAAPPMPMPPNPAAMERKAGGRISKVASSYKDMEAGSGTGEGRLQKTDVAKKHHDAPARKAGGRISKVAKSYKDMTAGAGTGEGRLQKEDIALAKKARRA